MRNRDHVSLRGVAIGYTRQSLGRDGETADTSLSLAAQASDIHAYAARHDLTLHDVIRDHDLTGDNPNRPGLIELIRRVGAGEAAVVVVHKWDRLARDLLLQEQIIRPLEALGVRFVSLTEPGDRLGRVLYGAIAEQHKLQLGDRLRSVIAQRAARGYAHSRPPFGYTKTDKQLVVIAEEAAIVRTIYEQWLAGWSMRRMADALNAEGVPAPRIGVWTASTLRKILRNPAYAGLVRLNGATSPGAHEAIIDRELWEQAQAAFVSRPHVRIKALPSWLDGHVEHACGHRMYLVPVRAWNGTIRPVFRCRSLPWETARRCTETRPQVSARKLEIAARVALAIDLADVCSMDEAISSRWAQVGGAQTAAARREIEARRADLLGQRQRIEHLHTTGRRGLAWFDAHDALIAAELAALEARERALPAAPDETAYRTVAGQIAAFGPAIHGPSDAALADLMAASGIVIVGADGIRIRYRGVWADYVRAPVTVPLGRSKRAVEWELIASPAASSPHRSTTSA